MVDLWKNQNVSFVGKIRVNSLNQHREKVLIYIN